MKRIIWMLLIVSSVAQPLNSTGIYMLLQADRPYTASHLCEQRQALDTACQGTGYLQKQAVIVGRPEQQDSLPQKQPVPTLAYTIPYRWATSLAPFLATPQQPSYYSINAVTSPCFSIFHPPWLIS